MGVDGDGSGSVEAQPDIVKFGEELLCLLSLLGQRLRAGHRLRPDPAVKLRLSSPAKKNQAFQKKELIFPSPWKILHVQDRPPEHGFDHWSLLKKEMTVFVKKVWLV